MVVERRDPSSTRFSLENRNLKDPPLRNKQKKAEGSHSAAACNTSKEEARGARSSTPGASTSEHAAGARGAAGGGVCVWVVVEMWCGVQCIVNLECIAKSSKLKSRFRCRAHCLCCLRAASRILHFTRIMLGIFFVAVLPLRAPQFGALLSLFLFL